MITGVTGLAGTHLANMLAEELHGVELYGGFEPSNPGNLKGLSGKVETLPLEVLDKDQVRQSVEGISPDVIYHFAAFVSVARSFENPALAFQTNAIGTINLLEAAKSCCRSAKIMVPGSAEAYGRVDPKDLPITELQPLRPRNPYGLSKASQEMIAQYYQEAFGMNIYLTRSFNYTGPGQPAGFVCSDFANQIAEIERGMKGPVISVGNLKAKRDFLDIRDVVRAYRAIVEEGRPGVVYNVCSGRSVSIEEVLETLVRMSHSKISVSADPARLRPVDVPDFVGDNSRLVRETSWRQRIAFADSLRDVLEFWRRKVA